MNERARTPEGELVRIAHILKDGWNLKPKTDKYNYYVNVKRWHDLGGRTIKKVLKEGKEGNSTRVFDVISRDLTDGYK